MKIRQLLARAKLGLVNFFLHPAARINRSLYHTDRDPWRCERCGSKEVEVKVWVDANTGNITDEGNIERNDRYCRDCDENTGQVRESELLETIEKWFANDLQPDDDEVISGLNRNDFTTDEAFETACKEKWDVRDVESKIGIWRELTRDKSNVS